MVWQFDPLDDHEGGERRTASIRNADVLVLTRSVGEAIRIGPDVYVTVVRISPNSVRIGIEAPQQTSIVRRELAPDGSDDQHSLHGEPIEFRDI